MSVRVALEGDSEVYRPAGRETSDFPPQAMGVWKPLRGVPRRRLRRSIRAGAFSVSAEQLDFQGRVGAEAVGIQVETEARRSLRRHHLREELALDDGQLIVAGALAGLLHHQFTETIARQGGDPDSTPRRRNPPSRRGPQPHSRQRSGRRYFQIPGPAGARPDPNRPFAALQERLFVGRLAEADTVVADHETEVDRDIFPFLLAVPRQHAEQHVMAIPDADAFVGLLALPTAARAQ